MQIQRMYSYANERLIKHLSMPLTSNCSSSPSMNPEHNPTMQDLLWISKQQQQHPATHAHPLKNTIRINAHGIRYKFDGKQWRPLCQSSAGQECRNLAFRSSLCQKHFYKIHLYKRPYIKHRSLESTVLVKHPSSTNPNHNQSREQISSHGTNDDDDDSIQLLENNDSISCQQHPSPSEDKFQPEFTFFSIDCDLQGDSEMKPLAKSKAIDSDKQTSPRPVAVPKVIESIRLGLPPLTRTEEKSLAQELISQLPTDASLSMAEQCACRRACDIVLDNYSHQITPMNITPEWFYDFLLRNPRVPIHFQTWFSTVNSTMPSSDHLIDIKMWELKLITRSVVPSSSISTDSASP